MIIDYKLSNSQESKAYWMFKTNNENYDKLFNPKNINQCPKDTRIYSNSNCNFEELQQFHTKHLKKYKEITPNIHIVLSFNSTFTKFKCRICNYIKLKYQNIERCCYITTFDLIIFDDESTTLFSNESAKIFLINKRLSDYRILMNYIEYLMTIKYDEEKTIFVNWIIREFDLVSMKVNIDILKSRNEFIGLINKTMNDYMFREGYYDKIIRPCLNILFIDIKDDNDKEKLLDSSSILINICENEIDRNLINTSFLTFITYHLPYEESKNYTLPSKADILYKYAKKHQLENYLMNEINNINLTHRTIKKEGKYNYNYQKVIGFGACQCKGLRTNIMEGKYNIGESSHGTILFNEELEPVGVACYGNNYEYYHGFDQKEKKMLNYFIPFNNLGLIFLMKRYLGTTYKELESILLNDLDKFKVKQIKSEMLTDSNKTKIIDGDEEKDFNINTKTHMDKMEEIIEENSAKKETDESSARKFRRKSIIKINHSIKKSSNNSKTKTTPRKGMYMKNDDDIYHYDQTFLAIKRKRKTVSLKQLRENELK